MALVYKRSDQKKARAYERSPGMEPNPGVTHLAVVGNPGRRRSVRDNPFQWVEGRGQGHQHVSKPFDTIRGAVGWKKRNPRSEARLYPVDEKGTIVSRPVRKKLLSNRTSRRTGMAYNIGALRRAMRSNPKRRSSVSEEETAGGVKVSSRGRRRKPAKKRSTKRRRAPAKRRRTSRKAAAKRRSSKRRSSAPKRRASKRRSSKRRSSRRRSTGRRGTARSSARSRAAKKGWRKRRARLSANPRRRSRRTSRRRSSKRRGSRRRASRRRVSVAANRRRRRSSRRRVSANRGRRGSRRSSRRRSSRRRAGLIRNTARGARRRASKRRGSKRGRKRRTSRKYYWGTKRVTGRGKEYLDKYTSRGLMPTVAPVYHTGKKKSGAPSVLVYPIPRSQGRLSKKPTRRRVSYKRGGTKRRRRTYAVGASYRGRRKRRMAANRRTSRRRSSRRRGTRRKTTGRKSSKRSRAAKKGWRRRRASMSANPLRRRSRRTSRRRGSRRSSRRRGSRRRLTRNLLSTSKVQWGVGPKKYRTGSPRGKRHQVVMYGSRSKGRPGKRGTRRRISGYPVYIPGHVVGRASVRRFKRLGGAAKDAHGRAKRRGYSEKRWPKSRLKRNTRRTSMRKNRRRRSSKRRRRSTRRNPRWVVANRRRRRLRKNQFFGADLMKDVVTPVIGGTAGFIAARVLSNGLANIEAIRGVLDKGAEPAGASNTKIAANVLGILATLGLSTKVQIIRRNQGALITGMGLALADRLLGRVTGEAAAYLSGGFGEYVNQPLGEYVNQPLGAYVNDPGMGTLYATAGMGEYVNQPLGAYAEGVDPADQGDTDSLMDVMEAAAGAGQYEAAAGMGTLYATAGMGDTLYAAAGLGQEADARLKAMYANEQPPFVSIHTPTGVARHVTGTLPFSRSVPTSLVTPEGKGYAGGLFARHLFAGMFS